MSDKTTPDTHRRLMTARVYMDPHGLLVITAEPSDVYPEHGDDEDGESGHNCDAAGCGWEHVLAHGVETERSRRAAKET